MINEFSSEEIERQAMQVETKSRAFYRSCGEVIECLTNIKNIIKTEDSSLYYSISRLIDVYGNVSEKTVRKYQKLVETMNNYAHLTRLNETKTESGLSHITSNVEDSMKYFKEK